MPLPATLIAGLAKAATNKAVQTAAIQLAQDVYGRILPGRKEGPVPAAPGRDPELFAALGQLATKEEVAAAFALLQAEMDRRHRRTQSVLGAVILLQIVSTALLLILR